VYGPVQSWRYGRSLGIDPIGSVSTCSFDCVYCQLGGIDRKSCDRQIFIPTAQIAEDLQQFAPWDVDVLTLSGSGEPTLALNLGDIIETVKAIAHRPVGVLTNGSMLTNPTVRAELGLADWVAVKLDAISVAQFKRVNRPADGMDLMEKWVGLYQFRQEYSGSLAIQTMMLHPWSEWDQSYYIRLMQVLAPNEIQLNIPSRPRPLTHEADARGNHLTDERPYLTKQLKLVSADVLYKFGDRIQSITKIPVRYPKMTSPAIGAQS
jgi:wyosine [tRNA(Phe)-imidazoG37] synthetase (radical SAM superfamily)